MALPGLSSPRFVLGQLLRSTKPFWRVSGPPPTVGWASAGMLAARR